MVFADDMRPVSLAINEKSPKHYEAVLKVPVKNGSRLDLNVFIDGKLSNDKTLGVLRSGAYIETWEFSLEPSSAGIDISIPSVVETSADVLLRITNANNDVQTAVINADRPMYTYEENKPVGSVATTYTWLGFEHILIGLDHLLFVGCLIFIARGKKLLLLTITGFTFAHSLTLFLASVDYVRLPIIPVEAVIALSIVFLATEIAKNQTQSLSFRFPILVSSSFGLLHGFGFASVLADIGLPEEEKITALLFFNVGVEIGQLVFVIALFILYSVTSFFWKWVSFETLRVPVSYSCGITASFWLLQRLSVF